jgi:hypothetical protein
MVALLCLPTPHTSPCSHAPNIFFHTCGDAGKKWLSLINRLSLLSITLFNLNLLNHHCFPEMKTT